MARPKTPTNILKLRGADKQNPQRMKARKNEPKPPKAEASPPTWLSRRGRKIFRDFAKITEAMDVLTGADHDALAMLADAQDDYLTAAESIRKQGATYKVRNRDETELIKANPAVIQKADAWRRVQSSMGKFGLDPTSRAGLTVNHPESDNPFDIEPLPKRKPGKQKLIPGTRIIAPDDYEF